MNETSQTLSTADAARGPWDVLLIGAGPSGCSAATVLARYGHRVAMLEKESFPRYKIGESLIPWCWYPLQRLGVVEQLDAAPFAVRKYSVQFVGTDGTQSTPFYFFQHRDHDSSRTWQVVRSEFDQMLLDTALAAGVHFVPRTTARHLLWSGAEGEGAVVGVRARDAGGEEHDLRARVVFDCSGRDTFAQSKLGWRVFDPQLKKMAVWCYYEGAKRDGGLDEGATTIAYIPGKGWFWYIPLPGDQVSVGVVADKDYLYREGRDPEAIFQRELALQPWVRDHLAAGRKISQCRATGDYSFRSKHSARDGLVLVGDAFAFLDPVFSSGVFLALTSGVKAADAAHIALTENDVTARRFADYTEDFVHGIEAMRRLVYAFYDQTFAFAEFLGDHPGFRGELTDCLIGNVQRDFDPMFRAVSEYAQVPEPLDYGRPLARTGGD